VIGMVGVIDDVARRCTAGFRDEGDLVGLVGPLDAELDGSEYQRIALQINAGAPPRLDIDLERRVQAFVLEAIEVGLLHSAHDCSEGGLAIALAESCLLGDIGARLEIDGLEHGERLNQEAAGILFGESQSRFLISFAREALVRLHELAARHSIPFRGLGSVGGEKVNVTGRLDVSLADVRRAHEGALIERE
jgi:phosphoribosylformylglycinamidine (FGAM) synthase-like enzyme